MVETTMRKSDRFLSCKNKILVIYVHICHHQQIRTTRKTQPSLKRFILSFDRIHTKKGKERPTVRLSDRKTRIFAGDLENPARSGNLRPGREVEVNIQQSSS